MKEAEFKKVYIALGSNISDREENLARARDSMIVRIGALIRESHIYETEPWGYAGQPDFLNQVMIIETQLSPWNVLDILLETEREMGRIRTFKNASRIIDLDILFYEDEVINDENLTIPHPFIAVRRFVLKPLAEIAPELIHPVLKKPVISLLDTCLDPLRVRVLNPPIHS